MIRRRRRRRPSTPYYHIPWPTSPDVWSIPSSPALSESDQGDQGGTALGQYRRFDASQDTDHAIVYGPTQIGKTAFVFDCIKASLDEPGTIVAVTCANRKAIMEQTQSRFTKFKAGSSISVSSADVGHVAPGGVIFCLDNYRQIDRVLRKVKAAGPRRLVVFHDEGDTYIRPDSRVSGVWERGLAGLGAAVKHVIVTATPILCHWYLETNAADMICLEPLPEYTGPADIELLPLTMDSLSEAIDVTPPGHLILYATDRARAAQGKLLVTVCRAFPSAFVLTYNSNDYSFFLGSVTMQQWLEAIEASSGYVRHRIKSDGRGTIPKSVALPAVLELMSNLPSDVPRIIIGKELINRGTTFCSGDMAAVSMVADLCPSTHATQIVQLFGRLTGTAAVGVHRRIWTDERFAQMYREAIAQADYIRDKVHECDVGTTKQILEAGIPSVHGHDDRLPVPYVAME